MQNIFGPVPSRRLGRSLGVDVVPRKTCSYDCVYCESGSTTHLTIKRADFVQPDHVLRQLVEYFQKYPRGAEVITFSSAGEPTLYRPLGTLLRAIKKRFPELPLVVLTNGSLLWQAEVRADLMAADRVVPSLDAATPAVFARVNAHHPGLDLDQIREGIRAFRREYKGELHLEVLMVAGYNDSPEHVGLLGREIETLNPDHVELNTVVRPPAKANVRGLTESELQSIASFWPQGKVNIVGRYRGSAQSEQQQSCLASRVMQLVKRRPCSVAEMAASMGLELNDLYVALAGLEERNMLERRLFRGVEYVCSCASGEPDSKSEEAASGG